jgi:hypothetical protein
MPTLCETKRNETEMGEIDLEAPFRFIRFFSVLSATLHIGPVKISSKYLALQSAAISIFYGK